MKELIEKIKLWPEGQEVYGGDGLTGDVSDTGISTDDLKALATRYERLQKAAGDLVEAVDQASEDSSYLFMLGHSHGMPYTGRQYGEELTALRAELEETK